MGESKKSTFQNTIQIIEVQITYPHLYILHNLYRKLSNNNHSLLILVNTLIISLFYTSFLSGPLTLEIHGFP